MIRKLTDITEQDLDTTTAPLGNDEHTKDILNGASLGVGTIFLPLMVLAITYAITRNTQVAAALCFFTYAQLAFHLARRRAVKRKQIFVEAFRVDRRRQEPHIDPASLPTVLAEFSHINRRAVLAETAGVPVGALMLVAVHVGQLVGTSLASSPLIVLLAPLPLLLCIGLIYFSLRRLKDLLHKATGDTHDPL